MMDRDELSFNFGQVFLVFYQHGFCALHGVAKRWAASVQAHDFRTRRTDGFVWAAPTRDLRIDSVQCNVSADSSGDFYMCVFSPAESDKSYGNNGRTAAVRTWTKMMIYR